MFINSIYIIIFNECIGCPILGQNSIAGLSREELKFFTKLKCKSKQGMFPGNSLFRMV